jgi:hypothetical protein
MRDLSKTATLDETVNGFELYRLSHSIQGHRMRSDGRSEPLSILFVIAKNGQLWESNKDGEVVGFGSLAKGPTNALALKSLGYSLLMAA